MTEYQILLDVANIASGFATTVVAFFVWYQLRQTNRQLKMTEEEVSMTKHQMDTSLRPWMGAEKGLVDFDKDNDKFGFIYQNYGALPTTGMKAYSIISDEKIVREELINSKEASWPYIGITHPGQIKAYILAIDNFHRAEMGEKPLWIGFRFDYSYSENRSGQYGVIYEYFLETQKFTIRDEWSN